jgi:YHS domain-containing protein
MKIVEMTSRSPEQTKGKAMTKDPICGMTVDESTALRAERDGQIFHFCSEHCRKKFLSRSAPAKSDGDCCSDKGEHADHDHEHGAARLTVTRTTTIPITITTMLR